MALSGGGGGGGASAGAVRAGRAFVELFVDDKKLRAGLDGAARRLKGFGSSLTSLGKNMALSGAALALPLGLAIKEFANFDDAMRATRAVVGASAEEFDRLSSLARTLGQSSGVGATSVAQLMTELGKAGFTAGEVESLTSSVVAMARAGGVDAKLAGEILGSTVRQFGLAAADGARVADVLAEAANRSNASIEGLGESLQYAGPVAADLGISLEDTVALLGTLGNAGIKGSEAGTALRRLGVIAASQSQQFKELLGVDTKDAAGGLRPLVDILDEVAAATKDMGNADRAAVFEKLFGILGITGASVLSKTAGSTREMADALKKAGGRAAEVAKEMDAGMGGTIRRLLASVEELGISLGGALAPTLQIIGAAFQDGAESLSKWIKESESAVVVVAAVAAGLVVGGIALVGFGAVATIVAATLTALSIAVGAVLSPIGLVVTGLAGLGIAWVKMTASGKEAMGGLGKAFDSIGRIAGATWKGIVDAFKAGDLGAVVEIAGTGMSAAWSQAVIGLEGTWDSFTDYLADTLDQVVLEMKTTLLELAQGFINVWDLATDVTGAAAVGQDFRRKFGVEDAAGGAVLLDEQEKVEKRRDARKAAADKRKADAAVAAKKAEVEALAKITAKADEAMAKKNPMAGAGLLGGAFLTAPPDPRQAMGLLGGGFAAVNIAKALKENKPAAKTLGGGLLGGAAFAPNPAMKAALAEVQKQAAAVRGLTVGSLSGANLLQAFGGGQQKVGEKQLEEQKKARELLRKIHDVLQRDDNGLRFA